MGVQGEKPSLVSLCAQLPQTAMGLTPYFTVRSRRPTAVDAPTSGYGAQVQVWLDVPLSPRQTEFKTHTNYKFKQFETIHALLIFYKLPSFYRAKHLIQVLTVMGHSRPYKS